MTEKKALGAHSIHQRLPHLLKKALNWRMKSYGDVGDPPEKEGRGDRPERG